MIWEKGNNALPVMQLRKTIKWIEPIELASNIKQDKWALLYSGQKSDFTGDYSIIAMLPADEITSSSFDELSAKLSSNKDKFANAWFGYLGYGLKNSLEQLPHDHPCLPEFPDLYMVNYRLVILFNHTRQDVEIWSESEDDLQHIPAPLSEYNEYSFEIANLASNMTKDEYFSYVEQIKEAIKNGDLYQANLTRKFSCEIKNYDAFAIFKKLCNISPAPYSAFLKFDDKYIISSSPERFLKIDETGLADTRPIKGSAPRFADKKADEESKEALKTSEKERAENLMIVDLCRNDLSRSCVTGSVKTSNLFEVTSYATVHHMASTVTGEKRPDISTIELVKGCFPPGSMTGAPKLKAIELCSEIEKDARGVYSGSIGFFGGDGSADLSVVIRTILISGNKLEFQVGGAITSGSTANPEWQETITKARAICLTLGIEREDIEGI